MCVLRRMIADCPHCFLRVLPSADGFCPSCGQNTLHEPSRPLVAVTISTTTRFPQNCHRCNAHTRDVATVSAHFSAEHFVEDKHGAVRILLGLFSFFLLPITLVLGQESGTRRTYGRIDYEIPTCPDCRASETRIIESIPEQSKIRIAVHRDFATKLTEHLKSRNSSAATR
jgi:hypothetical protein